MDLTGNTKKQKLAEYLEDTQLKKSRVCKGLDKILPNDAMYYLLSFLGFESLNACIGVNSIFAKNAKLARKNMKTLFVSPTPNKPRNAKYVDTIVNKCKRLEVVRVDISPGISVKEIKAILKSGAKTIKRIDFTKSSTMCRNSLGSKDPRCPIKCTDNILSFALNNLGNLRAVGYVGSLCPSDFTEFSKRSSQLEDLCLVYLNSFHGDADATMNLYLLNCLKTILLKNKQLSVLRLQRFANCGDVILNTQNCTRLTVITLHNCKISKIMKRKLAAKLPNTKIFIDECTYMM